MSFLQSYDKLDAETICSERIDLGQVVAWVFVNGQWENHSKPKKKGPGSWCRLYLTSILSLNPAQYTKAKKELFNSHGLNGVYKHRTEPLYALVYKPSSGLSAASIAALAAGGAAVAGVGLTGRRFMQKQKSTSSPVVIYHYSSTPNNDDKIVSFINDSRRILHNNRDKILEAGDFPTLEQVRTITEYSTQERVAVIDALIASGETQNDLIEAVTRKKPVDYEAWINSSFWNSLGGESIRRLYRK